MGSIYETDGGVRRTLFEGDVSFVVHFPQFQIPEDNPSLCCSLFVASASKVYSRTSWRSLSWIKKSIGNLQPIPLYRSHTVSCPRNANAAFALSSTGDMMAWAVTRVHAPKLFLFICSDGESIFSPVICFFQYHFIAFSTVTNVNILVEKSYYKFHKIKQIPQNICYLVL